MLMRGDVTTFASVAGLPPRELELRIGYGVARLSGGYDVFELRQPIKVGDFLWGDQTRYSGTWQKLRDIGEYAQRIDILRFELFKRFNYNEAAADAELNAFLARQVAKLKVRSGPHRIVKLRPANEHNDDLPWWVQYPNSPRGGIPQWTILKGHEKEFAKIATVPAGGVLRLS
jgi:hypothetical protein